jgi:hypothetical protein
LCPGLGAGVRIVIFGRCLTGYSERDGDQGVIERIVHGARHLESLFGS